VIVSETELAGGDRLTTPGFVDELHADALRSPLHDCDRRTLTELDELPSSVERL
jgi:hypothetical protein